MFSLAQLAVAALHGELSQIDQVFQEWEDTVVDTVMLRASAWGTIPAPLIDADISSALLSILLSIIWYKKN